MMLSNDAIINSLLVCDDSSFINNAMQFFYYIGHSAKCKVDEIFNNSRYGILHEVDDDIKFTNEENIDIEKIICFGKLFTVDGTSFDNHSSLSIKYYAISIKGVESNRMKIARNIHKLLSRGMKEYSIVLFKWYKHIMISATCPTDEDSKIVISSDWYGKDNEDTAIKSVSIENLSFKSSKEFIADIGYFIAPNYYSHPTESYDRYYSINDINEFFMDGNFDRKELNEFLVSKIHNAESSYRDDYVDYSVGNIEASYESDIDNELALIAIDDDYVVPEECDSTELFTENFDEPERNDFDMSLLKDKYRLLEYLDDDF